ncbi:hypothetical protein KIN20_003112 [Parelaphostrongylus tenuis]|uniref:Uncharacterized protein n=1 Tax=Parelaphostrongylus tenuis TaxID=148309 RepID=A0AAD5LYP0_PARTN|nr:hypothetical protein KIN20_003112 [Parelaphostrongylus tenuis]
MPSQITNNIDDARGGVKRVENLIEIILLVIEKCPSIQADNLVIRRERERFKKMKKNTISFGKSVDDTPARL